MNGGVRVADAFQDERKLTYLNSEGADKPLKSSIGADVLDRARRYRMGRIREQMARANVAALLLYDPVNIRYAFDSSNMQVWTAHNPIRYAMILADGPGIIFEFKDWNNLAMSGRFEPGMVVCVESLMAEAGSESVKLETQVLITETGTERLDTFPWEKV